jgi:cyclomaltodextrinase / maltogenic alpha-amylase / neopullulanase
MKRQSTICLTFIVAVVFSILACARVKAQDADKPPHWAKSVVWYELFVERFSNGDPDNDPTLADITVPGQSEPPANWAITPWTSDWHEQEPWARETGKPFTETVFFRRYGGDLQGVLNKLDYLKDLGVTALYFRPLNDAPSLHKYDARSYHHIDVNFGPDPEGDRKIMASENPVDKTTWKFTSADKLFLKVIDEAHKRDMKVVLDYSWNHTGIMFWAFQDILKNQKRAASREWYAIKSFDDLSTPQNEFAYDGWIGVQSLPEIKKVDVTTPRVVGHPYEGNIHPEVKKHIYDVTERWLAPGGDVTNGIDGYRLDVADHIGLKFWREFRTVVKRINPNAFLVGEIWWEKWPDQFMDPAPYTKGDVFDAVMFYHLYRPARYFFAKTQFEITAEQFRDSLVFQWNRISEDTKFAMMNVASSADAPRLLSDFYNPNKYKVDAKPADNPRYKTGKPDADAYRRVRLYLIHAFTNIGAPHIYNGDEMGMWGGDDPEDRKPLWWKQLKFSPETKTNFQPGTKTFDPVSFNQQHFDFYRTLAAIRNSNPVLRQGKIEFIQAEGKVLSYRRFDNDDEIVVLFNLESDHKTLRLPSNLKYVSLLDGKVVVGGKAEVAPLSAMILKRM